MFTIEILDDTAIGEAFGRVATIGTAPDGLTITEIVFDGDNGQLTLTWNSVNGQAYLVEFSTSLEGEWAELAGPFTAVGDQATEVIDLPPGPPAKFFVRVLETTL